MTYQIETVTVEHSPMEVFVFEPDGDGPHPGLVLAQHIPVGHTGVENDEFTLRAAARFAEHGYVVAVPFIFHWWPKSDDIQRKRDEARDDWMCADMQAAFDLLIARSDVDARRIGTAGHCWGGRVAWLAACTNPRLAACAVFYGGRIKVPMGQGKDQGADQPSRAPIELAPDIRCPVAGFFGNDDANPSPADVDDYASALSAAGVEHVFHRYDGAGHAFQNFPNPDRYREVQSEDAWEKVLGFFARHLQG